MRHNMVVDVRFAHIPIFAAEIAGFVEDSTAGGSGILVDCTLGEGGHSEMLLERFGKLRIIAFERDPEILEVARARLGAYDSRIEFINDNFSNIDERLRLTKEKVDYIFYDFGISSYHFEKSGRGFGFARDEKLDMRLDGYGIDALTIVNEWSEASLSELIFTYGEERWARRIAAKICEARKNERITTTGKLAGIVLSAIPVRFRVKNIHPATRVFQAIRIEVNGELSSIKKSLAVSPSLLALGGRIMAISFHSLEDRLVKNAFARLARGCECGLERKDCVCDNEPSFRLCVKKPLVPTGNEISANPRSRSAKLRVCEKII